MEHTEKTMIESIEKFCITKIGSISSNIDSTNEFPLHLWNEMGSMGLLGVTAPEKYGGLNASYSLHCKIMSQISEHSASVGLSYAAHSNLCINQITLFGNEHQKSIFLPYLIAGKLVGALAMSEPNSGSDIVSMKLKAKQHGDNFILNGEKCWTTNGTEAGIIIVYAKTSPDLGSKGITAFLVPNGVKGLIKSSKLDKFGMRGSNTCSLFFDNVQVHKNNILGGINCGIRVMMSGLDVERLILSAGPVGIQKACLRIALDYAKSRRQFDKRICDFQLIQGKIADMYTRLEASEAFLDKAAKDADQKCLSRELAASVYLFCSESGVKTALDTIQILGGNGYTNEYNAGRLLRDAKLYEIGGGTTEIRRMLIARELCK